MNSASDTIDAVKILYRHDADFIARLEDLKERINNRMRIYSCEQSEEFMASDKKGKQWKGKKTMKGKK